MQYAVPLKEKAIAEAQCQSLGLQKQDVSDSSSVVEDPTKKYAALSRLHSQLEEEKKQKEIGMKEAKESMRMMVFAHEVFENIIALGAEEAKKVPGNENNAEKRVWRLFSNMSSADLLLLAHLVVQTSDEFPYAPIKTLVEVEYPLIDQYIKDNHSPLKELKLNIEKTKSTDAPTFFNTAYGWLYSWFA